MTPQEQLLRQACASRNINYITSKGNYQSKLCFVGEAGGAEEDAAKTCFVGQSGKELDRIIFDAGIDPMRDCWYTNPYKVRPPNNDLSRLPELGIDKQLYLDEFVAELRLYKPVIIVALGATPTNLLVPRTRPKREHKKSFGKWRGSLLISPLLDWPHYVIPQYHPAFILRDWSERQIAVFCSARAKEEWEWSRKRSFSEVQPLPQRTLRVNLHYEEIIEQLWRWRSEDLNLPLANDIETLTFKEFDGKKLAIKRLFYVIGLASSPDYAISFCLWHYTTEQIAKIFREIDWLLQHKRMIGQNFTVFDTHWYNVTGFRPNLNLVDDTIVMHHVLYPEMEHGLAFQTMQFTREPFYKDDGKEWEPGDDMATLLKYNATDCCVTFECWNAMQRIIQ